MLGNVVTGNGAGHFLLTTQDWTGKLENMKTKRLKKKPPITTMWYVFECGCRVEGEKVPRSKSGRTECPNHPKEYLIKKEFVCQICREIGSVEGRVNHVRYCKECGDELYKRGTKKLRAYNKEQKGVEYTSHAKRLRGELVGDIVEGAGGRVPIKVPELPPGCEW